MEKIFENPSTFWYLSREIAVGRTNNWSFKEDFLLRNKVERDSKFLFLLSYLRGKVHKYLGGYKLLQGYFGDGIYSLRGKVMNNLISMLFTRDYEYTEVFLGMR